MTVRNWGENIQGDWTLAIVDVSQGDLVSCLEDGTWVDKDGISCKDYTELLYCQDGAVGANWDTGWGAFKDYANSNGIGPEMACCDCGGGSLASEVKDKLGSWYLVVYGHDSGESTDYSSAAQVQGRMQSLLLLTTWVLSQAMLTLFKQT